MNQEDRDLIDLLAQYWPHHPASIRDAYLELDKSIDKTRQAMRYSAENQVSLPMAVEIIWKETHVLKE